MNDETAFINFWRNLLSRYLCPLFSSQISSRQVTIKKFKVTQKSHKLGKREELTLKCKNIKIRCFVLISS